MAVTVLGTALVGVDARVVEVEVDLLRRLPAVAIVGLPASAVRESAERVRSAIESSGLEFPRKRVVVNLAPADLRKEGTALDLPTALGILSADGIVPPESLDGVIAAGELALSGELREVRGALSLAALARELDRTLFLPRESAPWAALVPDARVVGVGSLDEAVRILRGELAPEPVHPPPTRGGAPGLDLRDVRGQEQARMALEVAAAGGHHMLMMGPPGCGKSMLARRLPSILPPLGFDEALEVSRIHAAANLLEGGRVTSERPFRAPHHTVSVAAMVGDRTLRPGELSLAHQGVLFLDEAPEFQRPVLEVLRQPLEEGVVRLSRAQGHVSYPAALTLVMAANPCPCGMRGSSACSCDDHVVQRYLRKLSGPILDRIDVHLLMSPVGAREIMTAPPGPSSAEVRERVLAARRFQRARGQHVPNGRVPDAQLASVLQLDDGARRAALDAADKYGLSARASTRMLRVARTLADLEASVRTRADHVVVAAGWRARVEG